MSADDVRRPRAKAELLVEPPRAGRERLGVAVAAELVREDREDIRSEEMPGQREDLPVDAARLAAAERLEDVVGDLRGSEERADEDVADRHAVLQRQKAVDRLEKEAPLGDRPDHDEREAVRKVREADVARIAPLEDVEIPVARDHGLAREVEEAPALGVRCGYDADGGARDFEPDVRPPALGRRRLEAHRGNLDRSVSARGSALSGREDERQLEALVGPLALERIASERREPADEEDSVRLVRTLQTLHPAAHPEVQLVEPRRLGEERDERKHPLERLAVREGLPVDRETVSPSRGEPPRRAGIEGEADRRARDPGTFERAGVAAEIGAPSEAGEHRGDVRENPGVVGIGAQEAERLVETLHGARAAQGTPRENREARPLPGGGVAARGGPEALEREKRVACGHRGSAESVRPARIEAASASAQASSASRRRSLLLRAAVVPDAARSSSSARRAR